MPDLSEEIFDRLPPASRKILLHAALWATDSCPAALIAQATPHCDLRSYAPAERAGLVTITDDTVVFSHPALRTFVHDAATDDERREVHRNLATALADELGRQAWHRATAADDQPVERARLYEVAAEHFRQNGRPREAARSMQLAAEACHEDPASAERLVRALEMVAAAGDGPWATRLWSRVRRITTDAALYTRAACAAASSMILTGEPDAAFETAYDALKEATLQAGEVGELFSAAALAVLASGSTADQARLDNLTPLLPPGSVSWSRPLVGAGSHDLNSPPAGAPAWVIRTAGIATWLNDYPTVAINRLREPLDHLHATGAPVPDLHRTLGLVYALIDSGRWDEADVLAAELAGQATVGRLGALGAGAGIARAMIRALRGDGTGAERLLAIAVHLTDMERNGLLRMLAVRARALAAVANSDFSAAFTHYCSLFHTDGRPAIHWASSRLVAELALASRRVGDTMLAHRVVARAQRSPDADSPRLCFVLNFAEALLAADNQQARQSMQAVATGPAARHWPSDRALVLLLYGLQLRRERRFTDADPLLKQALEEAHRLGAWTLVAVVQSTLRANGNAVGEISSSAFTRLTAQQQHIVRLAAQGLRNREIAAQLHLSERTIGSHLYHIFPKLGVAGRRQLNKVVNDIAHSRR